MTTILASEASSRLGRAVCELFAARKVPLTVAGDGRPVAPAATLVITDLGPLLMAGASVPAEGLGMARHARIAGLIDDAVARGARIVLVSGLQQIAGALPTTPTDLDVRRIEALLREQAAARSVILRVADVMDPTDPDLHAILRRLIDGAPAPRWPATEQAQVIGLADLAAATVGASQARGVEGRWFDIVHPEATSRDAVQAEARRIAQLLVDPDQTEAQCRPPYPPVDPHRDGSAGAEALHVRPRLSVFVLLAQAVQGMIADSVRQGTIAPIRPPMPAVHRALETGALPFAGMTAVVTGATGGIGSAAARMLVRLGADVIGVARRVEAGAQMERAFAEAHPFLVRQQRRLDTERCKRDGGAAVAGSPGRFRFMPCDLADAAALMALAARLSAEAPQIDILLHTAGEISRERRETPQGVEAVLALHMLAPVALTRLLAAPLAKGAGAWIINPVSQSHSLHSYDMGDLHSRMAYVPAEVMARAQNGLVALTGALAAGMEGTNVRIAAVALPQVRTPFLLPLEEPVTGGVTAQQMAQTQRERRRNQMDSPAHAASLLIEVMLAQDFDQAHGCLIAGDEIAGPILTQGADLQQVGALWTAAAALSGLPE